MELAKIATSYSSIVNFVTGGSLCDTLSAVADADVLAAKLALTTAKTARVPSRQVLLAVGHLQTAHTKYEAGWRRLNTSVGWLAKPMTLFTLLRKDTWVCCLMALCYVTLNEPKNAKEALAFAETAAKVDLDHQGGTSNADLLKDLAVMPISWISEPGHYFTGEDDSEYYIFDDDLRRFAKLIRSHC